MIEEECEGTDDVSGDYDMIVTESESSRNGT